MPPDLHCPRCGRTEPAGPDEPWRCSCGAPLELAAAVERIQQFAVVEQDIGAVVLAHPGRHFVKCVKYLLAGVPAERQAPHDGVIAFQPLIPAAHQVNTLAEIQPLLEGLGVMIAGYDGDLERGAGEGIPQRISEPARIRFGVEQVVSRRELELPIAPIDRIARLRIDNRFRVSMDARVALASILETYADEVAAAAATLARHADRRTIKSEDVEVYFELQQYFE